jgi:hypothetical protein
MEVHNIYYIYSRAPASTDSVLAVSFARGLPQPEKIEIL